MSNTSPPTNPFQRGNKLAVGKGRPPVVFTDEEVHELGQELTIWVRETDQIFHLSEFWGIHKMMMKGDWDALRGRSGFFPYYKDAIELMVLKTMKNKDLSTSYGNRFLAMYSQELREFEREVRKQQVEDEIAIKKADVAQFTDEQLKLNQDILAGITALQQRERA